MIGQQERAFHTATMAEVRRGDRTQTVQAIPKIVGRLHARHRHFVTVPRLLLDDPPPAGRPLPKLRSEG